MWELLTETREENGMKLVTWSEMGRKGLYEHREIVCKLLQSYGYKIQKTSKGIELRKK